MFESPYYYHLDIAAVFMLAAMICCMLLRSIYRTRRDLYFLGITLAAASSSFFDFLSAYTIPNAAAVPIWWNYAVNCLCLFSLILTSIFFLGYTIEFANWDLSVSRKFHVFVKVQIIFFAVFVFTTPFTRLLFFMDETPAYTHGSMYPMFIFFEWFDLLFSAVLIIIRSKAYRPYQRFSILFFVILTALSGALQVMYPNLLLINFAAAVGSLVILFALEDPSRFCYKNYDFLNDTAFRSSLDLAVRNSSGKAVIVASSENISSIVRELGEEAADELIGIIIKSCSEKFGHRNCFYINKYRIAVIVHTREAAKLSSRPDVTRALSIIDNIITSRHSYKGMRLSVNPFYCVIEDPSFARNVDELYAAIDCCLDMHTSSDKTVLYETGESLKALRRNDVVVKGVADGIPCNYYSVVYQPIYSVADDAFITAEALCRLDLPEIGRVPPDEFIPVAEKTGYIGAVGTFVLDSVCTCIKNVRSAGAEVRRIGINLSGVQLFQESTPRTMLKILWRHGLSLSDILPEITESVLVADASAAEESVNNLIREGAVFALDDYGTGFSCTAELATTPCSIIKIDKSLLRKAMESEKSMLLLESTMDLIKKLGKEICVEGVETAEMRDLLIRLGADYLQGFYFSKPLPEAEYIEFLKEHSRS